MTRINTSSKMFASRRLLLLSTFFLEFVSLTISADNSKTSTSLRAPKSTTLSTSTTAKPSSKTTSSTSKAPSAAPKTHTIQVGNGDHKFKPDVVEAKVGDTIQFNFYPANHSVVRAEYKLPCIPYEKTGSGKQGFFSDFHPVDTVLDKPPKYTIKINDTAPIFFYCSGPGACITDGMVGVINPNASTSLETQRQLAQSASYMLQPGEDFPAEEGPIATLNPTSSSVPPSVGGDHASHLSTGAIAGIAIACVGVLALGSLLFFFFGRFRSLKEEIQRKNSTIVRNTSPRSPFFPPPPPSGQSPETNRIRPKAQDNNNDNSTTTYPSPPPSTVQTPMTAHAAPGAYMGASGTMLPPPIHPSTPAYTPWYAPPTASTIDSKTRASEDRLSRAASRRSVGGTFDVSRTTGYYTRTHDGKDAYTYTAPRTADMTSPVDPQIVPVGGAYAGQMWALQRSVVTGCRTADTRAYMHVNHGQEAVEIEDTSKPPVGYI